MVDAHPRSTGEALFLAHLPEIDRITAGIARQKRLSADEAEEFAAIVHLQFIKGDYAILRQFQGRSSLRTFLLVVILRILLDIRTAQWGRWRPSLASRRHGRIAILLERLTMRDGLTFDQACAVIEAGHDLSRERASLDRLHATFRAPSRPRLIAHAELPELPCPGGAADAALESAEAAAVVAKATRALAVTLADIPPQDRLILKLRYSDGLQCSAIARMLHLDQKPLYGRIKKLTEGLRRRLESRNVQGKAVLSAIGLGSHGHAAPRRVVKGARQRCGT